MNKSDTRVVALAGNPNVGKSTVFNNLTGLRQHTGNWPGKTVDLAWGECDCGDRRVLLADLPGTYSLTARSAEERTAGDFLCTENPDAVIVVCDATCLERNLILALQILEVSARVVLCVNLIDEAARKGISVDCALLSQHLGVPVVATDAARGDGLPALRLAVAGLLEQPGEAQSAPPRPRAAHAPPNEEPDGDLSARLVARAEQLSASAVRCARKDCHARDRRVDKWLTSRKTGVPLMLALLALVFWLTLTGANYPSALLSKGLFWLEDRLLALAAQSDAPSFISEMLILGAYRVAAWVVAVMLPPMAIFFPLFTILEDLGYLPRVAFNLDRRFQKCRACGKQSLTMCMGFGCNAAGVVGCRIIDTPRERLIAILTNNFVPCNGRFPFLISIIVVFFAVSASDQTLLGAVVLTAVILLGVGMTFLSSRLLSATLLRGAPSSFTLELPPYRRPRIGRVVVRSFWDRTIFVLGRAVAVAAPVGLLIWLAANITVGGCSLLTHGASFLDPFARLFGLDGVILMAFILGWPANEIVLPIILMAYLSGGSLVQMDDLVQLKELLVQNGWTWTTGVCVMLFSLMHWPCATTCWTIKKETGSIKWTIVSILLPTILGLFSCFCVAGLARILGWA